MKRTLLLIEDLIWNLRCKFNFYLHGPYGVSKCIEKMPFQFIIKYMKKYGANIEEDCRIETGIILHRPDMKIPFRNLRLGKGAFIGHKSIIDLTDQIIFEDYSGIGGYCQIWTHQTTSLYPPSPEVKFPVKLEKGAICYSGVIVSPGITIGSNSRVGANSVVNKNIEPNCFCAGLPAKTIRENIQ